HVYRKNECKGAGAQLCQQLFSGFADEHAHAPPYELSPYTLLNSLAHLAANLLARIAHAFAFIRLRLIETANVRGHLTHQLLVDSLNDDLIAFSNCDFDFFRNRKQNRVRKTQTQIEV